MGDKRIMKCDNLVKKLSKIRSLVGQLQQKIDLFLSIVSPDKKEGIGLLMKVYDKRKEISNELNELESLLYSFEVKDAINPYSEAMLAGCILKTEMCNENIDIEVNLQRILNEDREAYDAAGCNIWAEGIPKRISDLKLTEEQIEQIKINVAAGEIPIVMPGRVDQILGLLDALKKLIPVFIDNLKSMPTQQAWHSTWHLNMIAIMLEIANHFSDNRPVSETEVKSLISKLNELPEASAIFNAPENLRHLVASVISLPEKPYIFTVAPRQDADYPGGDHSYQLGILNEQKRQNNKVNLSSISLGEYFALQHRFTSRALNFANSNQKIVWGILSPLDRNKTSTRFIDLPGFERYSGNVLRAHWLDDGWRGLGQIDLDNSSVEDADHKIGFRIVKRIYNK